MRRLLLLILLLSATPAVWGQTRAGTEFQVNSYTTNYQYRPSVAVDSDGNFIVVWQSDGQDGSSRGIFGQRFVANGAPVSGEFQVNSYSTNYQGGPSVAVDSDGDFVIVWGSFPQDGSSFGVFGQRYESSGNPLGAEFLVNTYTTGFQLRPSVAVDSDGDFVAVWESQDGSYGGIFGQRFGANGARLGGEFQVNSHTTSFQDRPSVAVGTDGDFVVVWSSYAQEGTSWGIFGQRFGANGGRLGGEFQVNSYTTSVQIYPSVAVDADGDIVVVWQSSGQDGSSIGVFGQRFGANGVPLGAEFQVNSYTTSPGLAPLSWIPQHFREREVHDAEDPPPIHAGVPPATHRTRSLGEDA